MPENGLLFRSEDLGGGLRLHLHRTKAFKTISARLALHANLDDQSAARAMVPRVLARGTRRLPGLREIQVELDRLYGAGLSGEARKIGERQIVQFRTDWVVDRLAGEPVTDAVGDLLGEYLHEPALDAEGGLREEVFVQERKMMADEARAVFDDKGRYARFRLVEEMCRGEPFARPAIGHLSEIEALTVSDVRRAHADLLARAPADLLIVGQLTWNQARRFARRLRLNREVALTRLKRAVRCKAGKPRTVRERQDVGQAKLEFGFRVKGSKSLRQHVATVLMNAIFGGSPVSKLFKNVREKESLCYSVGSVYDRSKGILVVQAGIEEANYARARRLVLAQLDDLRKGRISEEEDRFTRGLLASGLRTIHDSPGGLIEFALERAVNGVPADLQGFMEALASVRAADLARAARGVELDTVYLLAGKGD